MMATAYRTATLSTLAASTLLLACGSDSPAEPFVCTPGTPVVASYNNLGTFQADTVREQGVTVTGWNTVNVLNLSGLGIVDGTHDPIVDGTEWIRFDFDNSPVSQVSYVVGGAGNWNGDGVAGEATVEAFDRSGTSLGTMTVTGVGSKSVSTLFGDEPLSAFVVKAALDYFSVREVMYSPCE